MKKLSGLAIGAGFIALMLASVGGALFPNTLYLVGSIVCPGRQPVVETQSFSLLGESGYSVHMSCVGVDGQREEGKEFLAFFALTGVYFVALMAVFWLFSLRPKPIVQQMEPQAMPDLDVASDAEVRESIERGNLIQAIKRVRELTGVGLKEAKDYVEALRAGALPASSPARQAETSPSDPVQRMKQLKQMLDDGLITAQEYEAKKADILSRL